MKGVAVKVLSKVVAVIVVDSAEVIVGVSEAVTMEGVAVEVLSIAEVVALIVVDAAEVIVVSDAVTME